MAVAAVAGRQRGCPAPSAGGAARWPGAGPASPSTPRLLATLAAGRRVALVTGTNGKTTTTRLLAAALAGRTAVAVVSNDTGANMPPATWPPWPARPAAAVAVLEVDEGYLGRLSPRRPPEVVVLLNLSRDQLDRITEVRMLVDRWRAALAGLAAGRGHGRWWWPTPTTRWWPGRPATAPEVRWVGAGQVWHDDAVGCPACGGRIVFDDDGGWACDRLRLRPARGRTPTSVGDELVLADGSRHRRSASACRASSTGPTPPWRPWPPPPMLGRRGRRRPGRSTRPSIGWPR